LYGFYGFCSGQVQKIYIAGLYDLADNRIKTNDVLNGGFENVAHRALFNVVADGGSFHFIIRKQQIFSIS
jgi:hypothetical protein